MRIIFFFLMITASCAQAQDIRFVPAIHPNVPGVLSGKPEDGRQGKLQLPTGQYAVLWRKSELKGYNQIYTGSEWVDSEVDVWDGISLGKEDHRVTGITMKGELQSLVWTENEKLYQIKLHTNTGYRFSGISFGSATKEFLCDYPGAQGMVSQISTPSGRSQYSSNCQVVEIAFVSDEAFVAKKAVSLVEVSLVEWLAIAQTYFLSFETNLNFKLKALIIPTDESPFPERNDPLATSFGHLVYHMRNWMHYKGLPTSLFDITIGVTLFNYPIVFYRGVALGDQNALTTIAMRKLNSPEMDIGLLVHELGHAFGSGHDPQEMGTIMTPWVSGGSSWSRKSKDEINAFLATERFTGQVHACATIKLAAEHIEHTVQVNWDVSYEEDISYYILTHGENEVLDTIRAVGNEVESVSYHFIHQDPSEGQNVYRLYQYAKYDILSGYDDVVLELPGSATSDDLVLGPNPFIEYLRISGAEPNTNLVIYDASGRILLKRDQITVEDIDIKTNTWRNGLYIVKINDKVHRLIKE